MQLGDFVIEERIGSGGMGVVYRAVHPLIGKQAAIKVLRAELVSPQLYERLLVEARAVNAIRHPGIIDIFGFGTLPDGRPYVIMELLHGRPLSDFVHAQTRLDVPTTLWVLDHMLAALGAAHRAGVVHRDLKPANVFLVELPGAVTTLKLVDFGIAKLLESRDSPTTVDGTILGTPEFMAPEQIRGGTVGPATDLYAVGIMTFQMLTGVRPFQGEPMQVLFAHIEQPPPLPSSRAEGIPPELDTLVLQLLAKDPALRPASAEAVRQQLQRIPLHPLPASLAVPVLGAPRAPARASTSASPHSESLSTVSLAASLRTGSRGWMVGGAVLLAGLGGGTLWLGRSASSTEPTPIVDIGTTPGQGKTPPPPNPDPTTVVIASTVNNPNNPPSEQPKKPDRPAGAGGAIKPNTRPRDRKIGDPSRPSTIPTPED
ncbi:serine/threonine-protein kinase, partial [Corallococcus sp. CA053C]|uniref:serine/threonine-protein kinase n=1 Tax=Corallococcus sp. CA053C TaxID=2316732 RepID=UPI001F1D213D